MSAVEAEKKVEKEKKVEEKGGELLFCGATCWDIIGRKKGAQEGNLVSPTRLRPLVGVNIRFVASGSGEFHILIFLLSMRRTYRLAPLIWLYYSVTFWCSVVSLCSIGC